MADLICAANGNVTAVATWKVCDATFSTASTSSTATALTTSFTTSSSSTPGAITVDALAVKVMVRAAGTPTNNLILSIYNITDGTELTSASIPVSDLEAAAAGADTHGGWFLWNFGSTVLTAGKAYALRARLDSTSTAVSLGAISSVNYQRLLRTTTTQAPATGDNLYILGEWTAAATFTARTATIDATTTSVDLGQAPTTGYQYYPAVSIGKSGTLNATTASGTYYLKMSGNLTVFSGGTLQIGTTGTPYPTGTNCKLVFDVTGSGTYGPRIRAGATLSLVGAARTSGKSHVMCKLSAAAAATDTTLNVDTDTGWLDADEIVITTTHTTGTQNELRVLNGNASTASIAITAGLTNAHAGTSTTAVARVLLLTKNIVISNNGSTTVRGDFELYDCSATGCDVQWVYFDGITFNLNEDFATPVTFTALSGKLSYGSTQTLFDFTGGSSFTLSKLTAYESQSSSATVVNFGYTSANDYFATEVYVAKNAAGTGVCINFNRLPDLTQANALHTIEGFGGSTGIYITNSAGAAQSPTGTNALANFHAVGTQIGIRWQALGIYDATISAWDCRRNATSGVLLNQGVTVPWSNIKMDDWVLYGNATQNMDINCSLIDCRFNRPTIDGQASYASAYAFALNQCIYHFDIEDGSIGATTGHTSGDWNVPSAGATALFDARINCRNTVFGSATWINNTALAQPNTPIDAYIASLRDDQTSGQHKVLRLKTSALREADASVYNAAAPSEKITVGHATQKARSGYKQFAVVGGSSYTVSVYVRKTAAYNGNQPRLIVRQNGSIAITADTVGDTMTVAVENWEQLQASISPTYDGVVECYVDCDGTAGAVNVDDWSIA